MSPSWLQSPTKHPMEHKIMLVTTGFTILGVLLMLVALGTDYWVILEHDAVYRNASKGYVIRHHSGLWRICRFEMHNNTGGQSTYMTHCQMLKLFPTEEEVNKNPEIDYGILNYSRTETAFAVIALALMLVGHVFSFYTFVEPRYMFKRLAALMHLMTAICILVSCEVMVASVNYERANLLQRHPRGATIHFGYSFIVPWVVFVIYVIATIVFLVCSRKRKGDRAESAKAALENEPVHLGRV